MASYLIQLDLASVQWNLSQTLGCALSIDDVRDILTAAGFVESSGGWLANDLRPLMFAVAPAGRWLSGAA